MSYKDEGSEWGDTSINQGMTKIASKSPEAREGMEQNILQFQLQ